MHTDIHPWLCSPSRKMFPELDAMLAKILSEFLMSNQSEMQKIWVILSDAVAELSLF